MTILFTQDWGKHPKAVIHHDTKNESFLRMAEVYYHMGVSNNAFCLALHDPDLRGVDPHSPNLTMQQKGKIIEECKNNLWYFIREVARVPVPGSLQPTQFQANRGNLALYWFFMNHITVLIVILRQTGKTTMLSVLLVWLLNFGTTNTLMNFLTKSEGLKAETMAKIKALFEELPDWLNFSIKKDIFNSDEIKVSLFDNKLKGALSSSSPKQAEKVGRGFTSPVNLIDETAFIENIAIAMGAMLMSGNAARAAAKSMGKPYGTILATTAGNTDDRDGEYVYKLANSATVMDEKFFDAKNLEDLNELVYTNSSAGKNEVKRPIIHITLSYRQLGYSEEWMQERLNENISTPENIKRDLFNMWLSGSASSPIPKVYLELMRTNVIEIPRSEFYAPYNYLLRWYLPLDEVEFRRKNGHQFIIGLDTSDGVGRDDIAWTIRDHVNGEIICVATFNEINLITLADFFVHFMLEYTNSTMIIERRSSAATIIDYMILKFLQHGVNPFTRLYNGVFQNKDIMTKEYEEIINARTYDQDIFTKYKKHIGFVTSGSGVTSRAELYSSTLMSMLKYTAGLLYDEKLVKQISSLVERNNRIDHPAGGNDDLVISSLLGYWLLTKGLNLASYGIDTNLIMRSNNVYLEEKYSSANDDYDREEIVRKEEEFNELIEMFKGVRDSLLSMQLELKIKKLAKEMNYNSNIITVESLLDEIKRDKKLRRSA